MANIQTSTPTRRTIISSTAAALSIGTAVNAVVIVSPDRFADLERRWRELSASCQTSPAEAIADAVEAALPPPEALRPLPSDLDLGFKPPLVKTRPHYHRCDLDQFTGVMLRDQDVVTSKSTDHAGRDSLTVRVVGEPWPEKQARADEILAAYDPWAEQVAAMYAELGLHEAEELFSDRCSACFDLEREIAEIPPVSVAELVAKARLLLVIEAADGSQEDPIGYAAHHLAKDLVRLIPA